MLEISRLKSVPEGRNIFQLESPEKWGCHIHAYRSGLSELLLKLYSEDGKDTLYIEFGSPIYFQRPTSWQGADFTIGAKKTCINLLESSGVTSGGDPTTVKAFYEDILLFETLPTRATWTVQILAANATVINDLNLSEWLMLKS